MLFKWMFNYTLKRTLRTKIKCIMKLEQEKQINELIENFNQLEDGEKEHILVLIKSLAIKN